MSAEDTDQVPEGELPKEGDILAGKYRIDRVLGQGGMGVVVAAHHTTLRQKVAVKFLLPAAAKRGDSCERFLREARAAVSIQSEHVARVSDVGTLDNGAPYMVMEFLTGADLSQVLEDRGPLPVAEAIDYVLQACEAIAEAHSMGVIHRDLKPANLFLTKRADGSSLVKVLDFGLSKATKPDAMNASLTAAHVLMGSPYYMAPEQIRSFKTIDARADIWAMGVILYQLLTNTCPFESESLGGLFMAIGSDPVPSMRERRPDLPAELEAVINKCLEKDPKARTQTISELARGLLPFGAVNSHISVERIARVLSDTTPFSSTPSRPADSPPVRPSGAVSVPAPAPAPEVAKASTNEAFAATDAIHGGKTATTLAVTEPSMEAPKKRGGVVVLGGVAVVAAVATIVVMRGLGGGAATPAIAPAETAKPSTSASASTMAAAAPPTTTAQASSAPVVTPASAIPSAEPVASASASAPTASAPTASAQAARPGGKPGAPAPPPKGSAGPKLSKPVSAALKHDEKFD